ncbi:MAG TPA: dihydrodipicolinate synthase family protein, partial [Thermoanaerobaculia bacterium]
MKGSVRPVSWKGCGTALVTPFDDRGRIDFGALERLVDWQITSGIDFLVPCGTTGESATLSGDERKAVTAAVVLAARGRVPVIAGAGGNHTAKAVFWARDAEAAGADGILSVSPMYNKPTAEG